MTGDRALPPSFIVGCGRSGTTLLRAMLDSHPEIAVPPESYFVVQLLKQRRLFETPDGFDRDALLHELSVAPSFRDWDLDPGELRSFPAFVRAADVPDALGAAYASYAQACGKSSAVDKTPFQGQNVSLLANAFPGTRFIHLVRDGRDVARSLAGMFFGPDRLDGAILEWRRHVDAVDRYAADHPGEVLRVRYEDLVDDPPGILGSICDHLGLEFSMSMLDYTERTPGMLDGMERTDHLDGIRHRPTRDRKGWRSELTAPQVALLESLAATTLDRHGYERTASHPSVRDRARAMAARTSFRLRCFRLGLASRRARWIRNRRVRSLTAEASG